MTNSLLIILAITASIVYGIFVGRAKGARWRRLTNSSMTNKVFVVIGAVLFGIFGFQFIGHMDETAKTTLRQQFHLPADIEFTDIGRPRRSMNPVEGTVQFTEAQLQTYLKTIKNPASWPRLQTHDKEWANEASYDGIKAWHDLPLPPLRKTLKHFDDAPLIYHYWRDYKPKDRDITNGTFFCAYLAKTAADTPPNPASCINVSRKDVKFAGSPVRAILDFDTRTMYMRVR